MHGTTNPASEVCKRAQAPVTTAFEFVQGFRSKWGTLGAHFFRSEVSGECAGSVAEALGVPSEVSESAAFSVGSVSELSLQAWWRRRESNPQP